MTEAVSHGIPQKLKPNFFGSIGMAKAVPHPKAIYSIACQS